MREARLLLVTLLVCLAGCAVGPSPKPAPPDVSVQARLLMGSLARTFNARDVAGVATLFDENAAVVWPVAPGVTTSPEELKSSVGRAVKAAGGAKVTLQSARVARVGGERALAVSTWSVSGGKAPKMQLVSTDVLVVRDGAWRYLLQIVEPMAAPPTRKGRSAPQLTVKLSRTQCSALREWCMQACKGGAAGESAPDDCNATCLAGESHCTTYGNPTLFAIALF